MTDGVSDMQRQLRREAQAGVFCKAVFQYSGARTAETAKSVLSELEETHSRYVEWQALKKLLPQEESFWLAILCLVRNAGSDFYWRFYRISPFKDDIIIHKESDIGGPVFSHFLSELKDRSNLQVVNTGLPEQKAEVVFMFKTESLVNSNLGVVKITP